MRFGGGVVLLLPALLAPGPVTAEEAVMGDGGECQQVELLPGGAVSLAIEGVARRVTLRGVVVSPEGAPGFSQLVERIQRQRIPMRCVLPPDSGMAAPPVAVEYLGWRDKSGDVWLDLVATLIDAHADRQASMWRELGKVLLKCAGTRRALAVGPAADFTFALVERRRLRGFFGRELGPRRGSVTRRPIVRGPFGRGPVGRGRRRGRGRSRALLFVCTLRPIFRCNLLRRFVARIDDQHHQHRCGRERRR